MVEEDVEILRACHLVRKPREKGYQYETLSNTFFDWQMHENDYKFGRQYKFVPTSDCYSNASFRILDFFLSISIY